MLQIIKGAYRCHPHATGMLLAVIITLFGAKITLPGVSRFIALGLMQALSREAWKIPFMLRKSG